MPTHYWGSDFDWKALDEAINYIDNYCTKYGWISVSSKEKYGNADIYVYFWDGCVFDLLFARRAWRMVRKWPSWLRTLDFALARILRFLKITDLFQIYQTFIYRKAYDNALNKWPYIKEEIVGGVANWELLEDVMVKHKLVRSYRSDKCWNNEHVFNKKGYCSKCYSLENKDIQV